VLLRSGRLVGFGRAAGGALPTAAGGDTDRLVPVEVSWAPVVGGYTMGTQSAAVGSAVTATTAAVMATTAAVTAVACGSVVPGRFSPILNASAAVRAVDGRLYTWGAVRPWLGRGHEDDDDNDNVGAGSAAGWAAAREPAPVRFGRSGGGGHL